MAPSLFCAESVRAMRAVKQQSTRFSIVKRSRGQSAVEKASYISRSVLHSDYDGVTYKPKYEEDLVHSEIMLPEHAPADYKDRSVLWNSVEAAEKNKNAQLARMLKANIPNAWDKETAVQTIRDYVQRNFVSRGMCADFAIHDSVNPEGQHNLHIHVMLTMRPIMEDGTWGSKKHKIYLLDENGEKIRNKNGKGFKCVTEFTTDWDDRENAKKWRQDLSETINAVNERLGIDEHWEHRSFKDQGLEILPTVHLGPRTNALERRGIRTEKGDYNRMVLEQRSIFQKAKEAFISAYEVLRAIRASVLKPKKTEPEPAPALPKKNEVLELIKRVALAKGIIPGPEHYGLWKRFTDEAQKRLQSPAFLKKLVADREIDSFEELKRVHREADSRYNTLIGEKTADERTALHLDNLVKAYAVFRPYEKCKKKSEELTGWEKKKHDFKNRSLLGENYQQAEEAMRRWMYRDETEIDGKAWKKAKKELDAKMKADAKELGDVAPVAAATEILLYNKDEEERIRQIEERRQARELQMQMQQTSPQPAKKKSRGMEL